MNKNNLLMLSLLRSRRHYSTGALLAVGAIQGVWAATPSIDGGTAS
jgi:hypothetical protein